MSIFLYNDYREAIRSLTTSQKSLGRSVNFTILAESARIQRSYLSRVFAEQADLNLDQADAIADVLQLDEEEREYLILLVQLARSARASRRQRILDKIQEMQRHHLRTEKQVSLNNTELEKSIRHEYYSDPLIPLVHVFCCIPKYRNSPKLIAKQLFIADHQLANTLDRLAKIGMITLRDGQIVNVDEKDLHLKQDEPEFANWNTINSLHRMQHLQRLEKKDTYDFSVKLGMDAAHANLVQSEVAKMLKRIRSIVKKAPAEEVYDLSIVFFRW